MSQRLIRRQLVDSLVHKDGELGRLHTIVVVSIMNTKIIFVLIFGLSAIALVTFLVNGGINLSPNNDSESPRGEFSLLPTTDVGGQDTTNRTTDSLATMSGQAVPASPITTNPDVQVVSDGFYLLSKNEDLYGVFYDEPSGMMTITLQGSDTKAARAAVESYILSALPYSREEWCDFNPTVVTNVYEDPTLAGVNLGLSFCPSGLDL